MSEYINEGADIFNEEPQKKQHIVIRILKWIGVGIILLIVVLLFYRCVTSMDHGITKKVLVNQKFVDEYNGNPDTFTVEKYGMQSPWVQIRQGRLIEFNHLYFVPMTNQLQFSMKWNQDLPQCEYEGFPFEIFLVDDEGNEYGDYWFELASRERYRYARICFENVEIRKNELDENGNNIRRPFVLVIKMIKQDGSFEEICKFDLYDGSNVYRNVDFSVE